MYAIYHVYHHDLCGSHDDRNHLRERDGLRVYAKRDHLQLLYQRNACCYAGHYLGVRYVRHAAKYDHHGWHFRSVDSLVLCELRDVYAGYPLQRVYLY
jgi:hypothetical protein